MISINGKIDISQTKITQVKIETKQEETKKNSEKRSGALQKLRKAKEREPSPNEFLCDEEV